MAANINTMVRGMGMGMRILELLIKEIHTQGGHAEILQFLTRPRFKKNLKDIVDFMLKCDWRIPVSEMRSLAEKSYRREFEVNEDLLEEVRNLWWYAPLQDLGIPYESYENDPTIGSHPAIPPLLLKKFDGATMRYPFFIDGRVVVDWGTYGHHYEPGDKIKASNIRYVSFANLRYFDFDR